MDEDRVLLVARAILATMWNDVHGTDLDDPLKASENNLSSVCIDGYVDLLAVARVAMDVIITMPNILNPRQVS